MLRHKFTEPNCVKIKWDHITINHLWCVQVLLLVGVRSHGWSCRKFSPSKWGGLPALSASWPTGPWRSLSPKPSRTWWWVPNRTPFQECCLYKNRFCDILSRSDISKDMSSLTLYFWGFGDIIFLDLPTVPVWLKLELKNKVKIIIRFEDILGFSILASDHCHSTTPWCLYHAGCRRFVGQPFLQTRVSTNMLSFFYGI